MERAQTGRETVRKAAAIGVAAVGIGLVLSAGASARRQLHSSGAPDPLTCVAYLLVLLAGIVLVAVAPTMWRGTRTAVRVAAALLCAIALIGLATSREYEQTMLELTLAACLVAGRRAFPVRSSNRPRPLLVAGGIGAWVLVYLAVLIGPLSGERHRAIRHALHVSLAVHLSGWWLTMVEGLIGAALVVSFLAVRSLLAPAAGARGHDELEHRAARAIVWQHGTDSLSPFLLRPDKALHFAADGVLAYSVIGETAVVSGDPVAPAGAEPRVLASFIEFARAHGWAVAVWGASWRHIDAYRKLGLRGLQAGEEAFVDPLQFTLEGRRVRKLRQSVHRVTRRGWRLQACEGRELDDALEAEVDALENMWRANRRRLIGFAMGMGAFAAEVRPDDLYLLARSPSGELRAVMRFAAHCGRLSLDTMRRVGQTPNGLNEAMVCTALEFARERGVPEVSLNYAGLAHLVRAGSGRRLTGLLMRALGSHFQLDRLVRFNQKFQPDWRPRYLVYGSRLALPRTVVRVLQAEGYLPGPRSLRGSRFRRRPHTPAPAGSAPANAAG